jgi:hypothetical protein
MIKIFDKRVKFVSMLMRLFLSKRNIFSVAGLLFLLMQFVPVFKRTNPLLVGEPPWDSDRTRELARRACFDCHSNETRWPWYAHVAPIGWFLVSDVEEARGTFNLSDWHPGDISGQKAANRISSGEMPLPRYLMFHPVARLNETEKEQLIRGVLVSFK